VIPLRVPSTGNNDDYSDLATPDGRLLWTSPEMYDPVRKRPLYSTGQAAKFFFACGERWVYHHLLQAPKLSHPEIGELKLIRTEGAVPARRWRLYDVELFAHILASYAVLTGIQLAQTVRIIKLSAEMWGYRL
jgi:hypothetical protein